MNNLTIDQKASVFALYLNREVINTASKHMGKLVGAGLSQATINPLEGFNPRVCVYEALRLILRPLSAITDDEIKDVVRIFMGKEPKMCNISKTDTGTYILAEYNNEKAIEPYEKYDRVSMRLSFDCDSGRIQNNWDYCYDNGTAVLSEHLANSGLIHQYLIQQGFAMPLFIAPNHPANGLTAIELNLAIEQPKTAPHESNA